MGKLSVREIIEGTGGILVSGSEECIVSGVCQDSREYQDGYMFTAVNGVNVDGHRFIPGLVERGCRVFMVTDDSLPELHADGLCVIKVEDAIKAMQDLAVYYLGTLDARIVAVTGSVGKTSTRDILASVLSAAFRTGKTLKNYNNEIGLPLSILAFDNDIEMGVLEMGMENPGEIDFLVNLVRPDMAIITNIGISHIEHFDGDQDGIFRAKTEVVNYFGPDSVLAVPGEDKYFRDYGSEDFCVVKVGEESENDLVVKNIEARGLLGIDFVLSENGEDHSVSLPVMGRHNAINAALAVAIARKLGESWADITEGLSAVSLTGGRLTIRKNGGITVFDDTYNASPASMTAAVETLAESGDGYRAAVLGSMFELGPESAEGHRSVGRRVAEVGLDLLIATGELGEDIYLAALSGGMKEYDGKSGAIYFKEPEAAIEALPKLIPQEATVLVKASNALKLGRIVERLLTL